MDDVILKICFEDLTLPLEDSDLIFQGVLFPLEGLLVNDLDGVQVPCLLTLCHTHLRKRSPEKNINQLILQIR